MFNSIYYKCVLAQKLTGDDTKCGVGYGFTKSVIGNIFRVTVSEEEELERGRRAEIERERETTDDSILIFACKCALKSFLIA